MTTFHDKTRDENLRYDINREALKISALSSRKIDKYKYLTGEKILPSDQRKLIEYTKFTYSPLIKALKRKRKRLKIRAKSK